jgi:hypothetical protein
MLLWPSPKLLRRFHHGFREAEQYFLLLFPEKEEFHQTNCFLGQGPAASASQIKGSLWLPRSGTTLFASSGNRRIICNQLISCAPDPGHRTRCNQGFFGHDSFSQSRTELAGMRFHSCTKRSTNRRRYESFCK